MTEMLLCLTLDTAGLADHLAEFSSHLAEFRSYLEESTSIYQNLEII
jgi:hypothetical protein